MILLDNNTSHHSTQCCDYFLKLKQLPKVSVWLDYLQPEQNFASNQNIFLSLLTLTKWLQEYRALNRRKMYDSYHMKQDATQSTLGKAGKKYVFYFFYHNTENKH